MANIHGLNTYRALMDLGDKYDLSAKEAEETILRVVLKKLELTQECECKTKDVVVKYGAKWHKPHCRKCWRFSEPVLGNLWKPTGKYKRIVSDLENDLLAILGVKEKLDERRERRQQKNVLQGDLR